MLLIQSSGLNGGRAGWLAGGVEWPWCRCNKVTSCLCSWCSSVKALGLRQSGVYAAARLLLSAQIVQGASSGSFGSCCFGRSAGCQLFFESEPKRSSLLQIVAPCSLMPARERRARLTIKRLVAMIVPVRFSPFRWNHQTASLQEMPRASREKERGDANE